MKIEPDASLIKAHYSTSSSMNNWDNTPKRFEKNKLKPDIHVTFLLLTYSDIPQESVDIGQLKVSDNKLNIVVQFLATTANLGLLGSVPKLLDLHQ